MGPQSAWDCCSVQGVSGYLAHTRETHTAGGDCGLHYSGCIWWSQRYIHSSREDQVPHQGCSSNQDWGILSMYRLDYVCLLYTRNIYLHTLLYVCMLPYTYIHCCMCVCYHIPTYTLYVCMLPYTYIHCCICVCYHIPTYTAVCVYASIYLHTLLYMCMLPYPYIHCCMCVCYHIPTYTAVCVYATIYLHTLLYVCTLP